MKDKKVEQETRSCHQQWIGKEWTISRGHSIPSLWLENTYDFFSWDNRLADQAREINRWYDPAVGFQIHQMILAPALNLMTGKWVKTWRRPGKLIRFSDGWLTNGWSWTGVWLVFQPLLQDYHYFYNNNIMTGRHIRCISFHGFGRRVIGSPAVARCLTNQPG